jgi:hypothetical protein
MNAYFRSDGWPSHSMRLYSGKVIDLYMVDKIRGQPAAREDESSEQHAWRRAAPTPRPVSHLSSSYRCRSGDRASDIAGTRIDEAQDTVPTRYNILAKTCKHFPLIHIFTGVSSAYSRIKASFRRAKSPTRCEADASGQHQPQSLARHLKLLSMRLVHIVAI